LAESAFANSFGSPAVGGGSDARRGLTPIGGSHPSAPGCDCATGLGKTSSRQTASSSRPPRCGRPSQVLSSPLRPHRSLPVRPPDPDLPDRKETSRASPHVSQQLAGTLGYLVLWRQ
jgi:hypothetical protein